MQSPFADDYYQSVYFLDQGQVQREMRFTDFEAFLDGYTGLSDLANTDVKAVYAVITKTLGLYALVFFRIHFDKDGRADSRWNIPLDELIGQGGSGPDLGAGPIRLVCRSRCPNPRFAEALWDPAMSPDHNDFAAVRRSVTANRLRFVVKAAVAEPDIPVLNPQSAPAPDAAQGDKDQRARLARTIRQQRLRIKTLQSAHRDATRELNREHRLETEGLRREQLKMEQQVERLKVTNNQLKQKLAERNEQYLEFQQQISVAQAAPMDEQSQAELVLLREQLERKEREAETRREQLAQMEEQMSRLRETVPDEDSLMERLQKQSVFLVAYHAGVGHITLPYEEIGLYFTNPVGYAAAKCDLAQPDYEYWMAHYQSPVCQGKDANKPCEAPLMRVSDPRQFKPGIDDRCDKHQGN